MAAVTEEGPPAPPCAPGKWTWLRGRGTGHRVGAGERLAVCRLAARSGRCLAVGCMRAGGTVLRLAEPVVRLLPPAGRGGLTRPLSEYKAPNYWLGYRSGFVRRGLPGEVLRRLVAGTPSYRQVEWTAVALSRAAAVSVASVAVDVGLRASGTLPRAVATGLLLFSPLTCSLLLHDLGRYDAIGVLVLAFLSTARSAWLRLPLPVSAVVMAGAVSVAVASEEFLLVVLAPTVAAAVRLLSRHHDLSWNGGLGLLASVLAPGAGVAAASLVTPVPADALTSARAQAMAAGVRPAGVIGDALAALNRGFVENLGYFRLFGRTPIALSCALWAGFYCSTAQLLRRVLGSGAGGRYSSLLTAHALVGAALSAAGVDFRRWWGLALTGLMSAVALTDASQAGEPVGAAALAGAAALTVAGVLPRDLKVYPWGRLRVERALPLT